MWTTNSPKPDGFRIPQIGKGSLIGPLDKLVWRSGDRVYVPTLEEFIEACGENFGSLDKHHYGWLAYAPYNQSYFAKTSVEAVAHLWLALQKRLQVPGPVQL